MPTIEQVRPPIQEVEPTIETPSEHRALVGFQARVLLGNEALDPNNHVETITPEALGTFAGRNYDMLQDASQRERHSFWQETPHETHQAQKDAWATTFAETIASSQPFFETEKGQQWIATLSQFGVTSASPSTEEIHHIYDLYFSSDSDTPALKQFVGRVIDTYTENGTLNYARLKTDLPAVEWFSNIFGHTSSEVIGQMIDAEAKLIQNPQTIIQEASQLTQNGQPRSRINDLEEREEELLIFLTGSSTSSQTHEDVEEPYAEQTPAEEPNQTDIEAEAIPLGPRSDSRNGHDADSLREPARGESDHPDTEPAEKSHEDAIPPQPLAQLGTATGAETHETAEAALLPYAEKLADLYISLGIKDKGYKDIFAIGIQHLTTDTPRADQQKMLKILRDTAMDMEHYYASEQQDPDQVEKATKMARVIRKLLKSSSNLSEEALETAFADTPPTPEQKPKPFRLRLHREGVENDALRIVIGGKDDMPEPDIALTPYAQDLKNLLDTGWMPRSAESQMLTPLVDSIRKGMPLEEQLLRYTQIHTVISSIEESLRESSPPTEWHMTQVVEMKNLVEGYIQDIREMKGKPREIATTHPELIAPAQGIGQIAEGLDPTYRDRLNSLLEGLTEQSSTEERERIFEEILHVTSLWDKNFTNMQNYRDEDSKEFTAAGQQKAVAHRIRQAAETALEGLRHGQAEPSEAVVAGEPGREAQPQLLASGESIQAILDTFRPSDDRFYHDKIQSISRHLTAGIQGHPTQQAFFLHEIHAITEEMEGFFQENARRKPEFSLAQIEKARAIRAAVEQAQRQLRQEQENHEEQAASDTPTLEPSQIHTAVTDRAGEDEPILTLDAIRKGDTVEEEHSSEPPPPPPLPVVEDATDEETEHIDEEVELKHSPDTDPDEEMAEDSEWEDDQQPQRGKNKGRSFMRNGKPLDKRNARRAREQQRQWN